MKEATKLNLEKSFALFEEAKTLVPGGVLGARKPGDFIMGEYPIFLEYGKGSRLIDVDGNQYIDFLCGYGPIILGYREDEVDNAVISDKGEKILLFTHSAIPEFSLAKKINDLIPSAEMSIF